MRKPSRLQDYIHDVQKYCEEALSFIDGMSESDFLNDRKTQQAATLNIITIGEISTLLNANYPNFVSATPNTPWRDIAGMRHRLVHGYNEVNKKMVWETVSTYIPILLNQIPQLLEAAKSTCTQDTNNNHR